MTLVEAAIKRPVMILMLNLAFILFGIISFINIGVQKEPNITYPVLTITTLMPGADSKIINQTISKPIEAVLNTLSGVKKISSTSTAGKSQVEVQFALNSDIDSMFNQVQSKLNQVKAHFLAGTKPPIIQKTAIGALPIMLLGLHGNQTIEKLDEIARVLIKKNLEGIAGVAEVNVVGAGKTVLMVELNLAQMAALHISPRMVQSAFASQHVQLPGGFINAGTKQYSLGLDLEFHNLHQLNNMVVSYNEGAAIFLKDIATLKYAIPDKSTISTLNNQVALGINIIKRPEANTIAVVASVNKELAKIKPLLPSQTYLTTVYQKASYILAIIGELEQDTILSIFAAGLIIWFFLQNFKATLIVITAIPVSLLGSVMAIYFGGYTINIITLLAIILLVGVVVDDAIVVLENIDRCRQQQKQLSDQAAISATNQVRFTIFAASLSLLSIFIPVFFMENTIGLLFKSFAIVVSVGVLISLFVSLSLTPMLCANFMKHRQKPSLLSQTIQTFLQNLEQKYQSILRFSLSHRYLMLLLALVAILASIPLLFTIGKGFLPSNPESGNFQILVQTPQGSSAQYTQQQMAAAAKVLAATPGINNYFSSIEKANSGNISVNLTPYQQRQQPQYQIVSKLMQQLKNIPGALFILQGSELGTNMTFELTGHDYHKTIQQAFKLYNVLHQHKSLGTLYIHLYLDQPEYQLLIDRVMAKSLGLSAYEIGSATMLLNRQGVKVAKFNKTGGSQRYDVVLKASESGTLSPEILNKIYLMNNQKHRISLDTIAKFKSTTAPLEITRSNQQYSVSFSCSPSISLGHAITKVKMIANQTLAKGFNIIMTGNSQALGKMEKSMLYTLALIFILLYMVLASQFNSFIQPLIIMLAQPLAFVGGLFILWLTSQTLNMYSMIGELLLMGLVAKNSILLIDLTNSYRQSGMNINQALSKACPQRMRPVLMTSCAIILAMLPAAILPGEAASSHKPLAYVIIGGMISSTLLTLIIVPAAYSLVEHAKQKLFG